MSKRLNPMPSRGQVIGTRPRNRPRAGDRAHLVIQLRPADAPAVIAETDELDGVRVGGRVAAVRRSIDGVPSFVLGVRRPQGRRALGPPATGKPRPAGRSTRRRTVGPGFPGYRPILPGALGGRYSDILCRPAPCRKGGLSTSSSTNLSTRTGVRRTSVRNVPQSRSGALVEAAARRGKVR